MYIRGQTLCYFVSLPILVVNVNFASSLALFQTLILERETSSGVGNGPCSFRLANGQATGAGCRRPGGGEGAPPPLPPVGALFDLPLRQVTKGVQLGCAVLNEVAEGLVVVKHSPEVAARERARTKRGNSRAPLFPADSSSGVGMRGLPAV